VLGQLQRMLQVKLRYREGAAGELHRRRAAKIPVEQVGIESGGHEDNPQGRAFHQEVAEHHEQKV